jgi:hypothetical protein
MSPVTFSALSASFLQEHWTQKQHRDANEREGMYLGPGQAESCRSHVQDSEPKDSARHGSRSVREEALTAATFCACVDFVRDCIHPSSLAAQPPPSPCTRPPKTACSVRTLTAQFSFAARRPRSQHLHPIIIHNETLITPTSITTRILLMRLNSPISFLSQPQTYQ